MIYTLRVSAIRSRQRGGYIFTGVSIDKDGQRSDTASHFVVKVPGRLATTEIEPGQIWKVTGEPVANTITVNGFKMTEATMEPESIELLRPSGEHIITLLAENKVFEGIGHVKARKLWTHFGESLYGILDGGCADRLAEVLPNEMAEKLVAAWRGWGNAYTLQWLHSKGFSVSLGRKVVNFFGADTPRALEEDPYRLLSFAATWSATDALAREHFGIADDDMRRLAGAVEEALYHAFDQGDTYLPEDQFKQRLKSYLGHQPIGVGQILAEAERRRQLVRTEEGIHAPGPYVMERGVSSALLARAQRDLPLLEEARLSLVIDQYEANSGIQLHERQRDALMLVNRSAIAIITGGAGTGKTTVLRGLLAIADEAGLDVFQMALSGRASKRMSEATDRKAQTIAGFLKRFKQEDAPTHAIVVIDEASMVDLPSAYRLLRHLPDTYRFVLVGDPHQLPPVGPGLLLHEVVGRPSIPSVELTEVKRYGGSIAEVATGLRAGVWSELGEDETDPIAFLPCHRDDINDTVLRLYREQPQDTQILCPTKNASAGGVKSLNNLCQSNINSQGTPLLLWNDYHDQLQSARLRVGDPVICLSNRWDIDLQNGSLGVMTSVQPALKDAPADYVIGSIVWDDGISRDMTVELLEHLDLAYAITVHKSQGSQFKRVIIPIQRNRLLDRTLLYTAITRAQAQVLLVGDVSAAIAAATAIPNASRRHVALGRWLNLGRAV